MDSSSNQSKKVQTDQNIARSIQRYIKYVVGNEEITNHEFKQIEDLPNLHTKVNEFENNKNADFYIVVDLFKNINEWIKNDLVRNLQLTIDYLENHKMGKRLCPFSERTSNSFEIALQYFHKQFFNDIGDKTKINIYILKAK